MLEWPSAGGSQFCRSLRATLGRGRRTRRVRRRSSRGDRVKRAIQATRRRLAAALENNRARQSREAKTAGETARHLPSPH